MDSNDKRGTIRNRERKQQIIAFSGLRYGNITPTDIDGMIEYKDKAFIFMEMKLANAPCPYGQRLALERLVNACEKSGKEAIGIICEHYVHDCKKDITASDCIVREVYFCGRWRKQGAQNRKLKEFCDAYINWISKF